MAYVVRYATDTGQIDGVYQSEVPALLDAQQRQEAGIAYLRTEQAMPLEQQDRYEVRAGQLVAKAEHQLTASVSPFPADGQTECQVTLTPFAPCTLLVNLTPVVLTEADPVLLLTAASARQFAIRLQPQAGIWAAPLNVEAL